MADGLHLRAGGVGAALEGRRRMGCARGSAEHGRGCARCSGGGAAAHDGWRSVKEGLRPSGSAGGAAVEMGRRVGEGSWIGQRGRGSLGGEMHSKPGSTCKRQRSGDVPPPPHGFFIFLQEMNFHGILANFWMEFIAIRFI